MNPDPVLPKLRADIRWTRYPSEGRWVAFDPLTNEHYYLSDQEHGIAMALDGHRTSAEIARTVERQCAFFGVTADWITRFVARLKANRLVLGKPPELRPVNAVSHSSWWRWLLGNPLALRVPLFTLPQSWCQQLKVVARVAFHSIVVSLVIMLGIMLSIMMVREWLGPNNKAYENIDWERMLQMNWSWLLVLLALGKSFHEVGHLLACLKHGSNEGCKRSDCANHPFMRLEIGLMFLCFVPCFYCDTSDAWRIASRWKRAAIAAAGIYFEWILASGAACLYLTSASEVTKAMSVVVFLACTLGTLMLNGNPFFRYDGYYILSDLWGVPNLAQQSSEALRQSLAGLLGGARPKTDRFDKSIHALSLYAVVSLTYRTLILVSVFCFVWNWFNSIGLGLVAITILGAVLFGVLRQVTRWSSSLLTESLLDQPRKHRRGITLASITVGLIGFISFVPISEYRSVRGFVEPKDARNLHIVDAGVLTECQRDTEGRVRQIKLRSFELELQKIDAEADWAVQKLKTDWASQMQTLEPSRAYEVLTLTEIADRLRTRVNWLEAQIEELRPKIRNDEVLIPATLKKDRQLAVVKNRRSTMHVVGEPLIGRSYTKGELIGGISSTDGFHLRGLIAAQDIRQLHNGQRVEVVLDAWCSTSYFGRLTAVSSAPVEQIPEPLRGDHRLAVLRRTDKSASVASAHYMITIEPESLPARIKPGNLGTIRIKLPSRTILERIAELISGLN